MRPIILLGLVAVAVSALGTGFLAQEEIMVNLQGLGVGSAEIESPVSNVWIDLTVDHIVGVDDVDGNSIFKNIVSKCSFHYTDEEGFVGLEEDAKVICKISDMDGDIIAEGALATDFAKSTTYQIPLTEFATGNFVTPRQVNDVTIVTLSSFTHPLT